MSLDLENKILQCVKHLEEFEEDYKGLVFEVRDLKKNIERLETERRELKRKIEGVVERVENHIRVRA